MLIINQEILLCDFSNSTYYKIDYNEDLKKWGVYEKLFDDFEWSWMNAINTNYSCIYLIINELYEIGNRFLVEDNFIGENLKETLNYIKEMLSIHRNYIFTSGSKIFTRLFFTSQLTWNFGKVSEMTSLFEYQKHYQTKDIKINLKRGLKEDLNGSDFKIFLNGEFQNVQHKSTAIFERGDYYVCPKLIYNKNTYLKINLISVDYKKNIYLFRNSNDNNLCGVNERGEFYIHENLKIDIMEKQTERTSSLLFDLNRVCTEKKIIFQFDNDGSSSDNYFEETLDIQPRKIKLFINDFESDKLNELLEEKIQLVRSLQ